MVEVSEKFRSWAMKAERLSEEELKDFVVKAKAGDSVSMEKIVKGLAYMTVVLRKKYSGFDQIPDEDFYQEACISIMSATRKIDVDNAKHIHGFFWSFIRNDLKSFIMGNLSTITIKDNGNHDIKKIFWKIRGALAKTNGSIEKAAALLDVPVKDVALVMSSLYSFSMYDDEGELLHDKDCESDFEDLIEEDCQYKYLIEAMNTRLNERERFVIEQRYMVEVPTHYAVLSGHLGISGERIRQIAVSAVEKLKVGIVV